MNIRNGLAFAVVVPVLLVAGCSQGSTQPNLVGTWVGDYRFALADDSANESTETLVITRQDGDLLWGYEQWEEGGKQMRADLTGTVTGDGTGLVLTEPAGFYRGTLDGDTLTVVFTRIDDTEHTAFEVALERQ